MSKSDPDQIVNIFGRTFSVVGDKIWKFVFLSDGTPTGGYPADDLSKMERVAILAVYNHQKSSHGK